MAISWSQGLLAAAGGVAEYSNQEQQKRQMREDKTAELENRMREVQAKSRYAAKMNEWIENRKNLKSLKGIASGSYDEQRILLMQQGHSFKDADRRATQIIKNGEPTLSRPQEVEEPNIEFNPRMAKTASSPIQDWVKAYKEEGKTFEPSEPKEPKGTLKEFQAEPQGSLEPMGGPTEEQPPEEDDDQLQAQEVQGQQFTPQEDFVSPYAEPVELKTVEQMGSHKGQKGKWVTGYNEQTGEKSYRTFFPSGVTSSKIIDPKIEPLPDGRTIRSTRVMDARGRVKLTGERWITKLAKDPKTGKETKIAVLEQPTREQYIKEPDGNQMGGQFYTDFPKEEQENWKFVDGDQWWKDSTPEGFRETMADNMLFVRERQSKVVDETKLDDVTYMGNWDARTKAMAYLKTLKVEGVIAAVEAGGIPPDVFFGPLLNEGLPNMQKIQAGILTLDEYKGNITKFKSQFTNSTQF